MSLKEFTVRGNLSSKLNNSSIKKTNMIITAKHLEMTNINNKIKIKLSEKKLQRKTSK